MNHSTTGAHLEEAASNGTHCDATRSIAEQIAEFAAQFRYDGIPEAVRERAKYLLLDAIGIAFASSSFDFARRAHAALASDHGHAGFPVIGMPGRMELRDAVLVNSMLVHGLDYDDTYFAGGIHPTASCFPAALGVAAETRADGRRLLASYVLGIEVATRLAAVAQGVLNQVGLHPSSLIGAFASAVVSGWLMNLDARRLAMAQGLALGTAAGTLESLQDGSWTKRIQPGWAAASGITAARLAKQGFIGAARPYEGRFGLFASHLGSRESECDYPAGTAGLGGSWELLRVALKPHPACHATQAAIEAAIEIASESGLTPEDVRSVTAIVPPQYVKLTCEPIERKRRPDSIYGAQFSLPYTVACAFARRRFGLAELDESALTDPRILALARKVGYQVDSGFTSAEFKTNRPAELVVLTTDGRTLSHRVRVLRGGLDRPLAPDEVIAKFMENATIVMSRSRAAQIRDQVLAVDALSDASAFSAMLAG
ncbi:MAG: MmgE/PrpD family protein [Betaproteobacteria bacterium]|nr:MmgE/PrpD family protein [Betaproteobacteria bacterium]MBI3938670.1 MmgE/PrpD family protein [Betaproteobacteria bacterium]